MKRKLILTAMLLVLLPLCLFAGGYKATWSWRGTLPAVTAYRYQLDGEDSEAWTEVPADVTEYTSYFTDSAKDLVLYVQASFDGVYWSPSIVMVAKAPLSATEETVAEETAQTPEVTADEIVAVIASTAPVEEVKTPVNKAGRWFINDKLGFNILVASWNTAEASNISNKARFAIIDKISAGYQFNDWFRLGMTTGFAYQFSSLSGANGYMYIPLTVDTDFRLASFGSLDFWTQLSAGIYDRIVNGKNQMGFMAGVSLYAEYAINDHFMLGGGVGITSIFSMFRKNSKLGLDTLLEVDPYLTCTYMF